jgi:hypothetical protein
MRQRSKSHTFEDRLKTEKLRLEAQARGIPHGPERDAVLKKIRELETASHMSDWLSSPGLQTPK